MRPAPDVSDAVPSAGAVTTATAAASDRTPSSDPLAAVVERLTEIRDLLASQAKARPLAVEKMLTLDDLADVLAVHRTTLERMRAAGKLLDADKFGGQLRFQTEEVREWIRAGMPDARTWKAMRRRSSA
jgi:excisionase family DNA binding protein